MLILEKCFHLGVEFFEDICYELLWQSFELVYQLSFDCTHRYERLLEPLFGTLWYPLECHIKFKNVAGYIDVAPILLLFVLSPRLKRLDSALRVEKTLLHLLEFLVLKTPLFTLLYQGCFELRNLILEFVFSRLCLAQLFSLGLDQLHQLSSIDLFVLLRLAESWIL